ncbi:MAG: hypothetical protein KatS3mg105_3441 [Gemmatales bacterium]|nr:MAG: hypothetical protein KatS3mg105_3441 [Gemmatales bacterium]
MKPGSEAERLTIYIGEEAKLGHRPMYEVIVEEARNRGLAGATAMRCTMGFGSHHRIHTAKILRLSEDLPVVIEIIDEPDQIRSFLEYVQSHVTKGLVTLEKVRIVGGGIGE